MTEEQSGLVSPLYEPSVALPYNNISYYGKKIKKLGEGSFGKVYLYEGPLQLGVDGMPSTRTKVAIKKIITDDNTLSPSNLREISLLMRMNHPNIIPILDIILDTSDTTQGSPHSPSLRSFLSSRQGSAFTSSLTYVMPAGYFDLKTLLQKANVDNRLLPDLAKKWISYQILSAFSYLDGKDILHRDLKPDNIIVFSNYEIKISDFGLARPTGCMFSKGMTKTVYTLWYRPLEILADDVDHYHTSSDMWSIGCVLYELWTYKVLFQGKDEYDMTMRIWQKLGNMTRKAISDIKKTGSPGIINRLNKSPQYPDKSHHIITEISEVAISRMIIETLRYDPEKRPSAYQLLQDPFFNEVRDVNLEYESEGCLRAFLERDWYPSNVLSEIPTMRIKLLEILKWSFEVWKSFRLHNLTFFYSQFLFDWAISKLYSNKSSNSNLKYRLNENNAQLVAAVCLSIAARYCQVYAPEPYEYLDACDNKYSEDDFSKMESTLLKVFSYDLVFATSYDFRIKSSLIEQGFSSRDLMINILVMFVMTISNVRFSFLPSDQYKLCEIITKAIIDSSYTIPPKWSENAQSFKTDIEDLANGYDKKSPLREIDAYAEKTIGEPISTLILDMII